MAHYDSIAMAYRDSKRLPFRDAIERHTLFRLLGDVRGRTVLDLACGEGHYARQIKKAGAAAVTGVDVSPAMIVLARAQDRLTRLDVRYAVSDAADYRPDEPVDLVVAMYLLSYAKTQGRLLRFLKACHRALKPGGKLVGFVDNVFDPPGSGETHRWRRHGFDKIGPAELKPGAPVLYRFYPQGGEPFEFTNIYYPPPTWEEAFRRAGFPDLRWPILKLEPKARGNPLFAQFMARPPVIAFTATRPTA